jgi:CAAX amino terminal protease family protein
MYTEIFFLSHSLWLVVLMHTMEDALNPLISEGFVNIPSEYNWLISPSL